MKLIVQQHIIIRTITGGTVDATTGKNVDVSIPYNTGSYTVDITTPDG